MKQKIDFSCSSCCVLLTYWNKVFKVFKVFLAFYVFLQQHCVCFKCLIPHPKLLTYLLEQYFNWHRTYRILNQSLIQFECLALSTIVKHIIQLLGRNKLHSIGYHKTIVSHLVTWHNNVISSSTFRRITHSIWIPLASSCDKHRRLPSITLQ